MGITIRVGFYTSPDKVKHSTCICVLCLHYNRVPPHRPYKNIYCMYTTEPKFVNVFRSPQ